MANRMAELQRLHEREPGDPFLRYGIAMEHKKAGRFDEALDWFKKTLEVEATYCYAYYQQAQIHEERGHADKAKKVYAAGIKAANQCNDAHAAGEMQAALDLLD